MHLDENELLALAAGGAQSQAWRAAQEHLDACSTCRAALAAAAHVAGAVAPASAGPPTVPSAPPPATSLAGVLFAGRYRMDAVLGRGGMGVVYRAWDERLGRAVALKVASRPAEAELRDRLLREARALAAVSHPRVVTVFDTGEHEGQIYLAMELIDGLPLDRLVFERKPPAREILKMGLQVGEGLAALHAAGLVHRDMKPANVMIDRDGNAKVMDLGLARQGAAPPAGPIAVRVTAADSETRPHAAGGTVPSAGAAHAKLAASQAPAETRPHQQDSASPAPTATGGDTAARELRETQPHRTAAPAQTRPHTVTANGHAGATAATPMPLSRELATPAAGATEAGTVLGTLGYMAPEQVRGQVVGAAADQFSYCVTLYECLAGRRPFAPRDIDAWRRGEGTPPPPLKAAGVPAHVARAIARGLHHEPASRFPGMPQLLAALSARPYRRLAAALAATGAVCVLLAAAWAGQRAQAVGECGARVKRIDSVWNPTVRAQLRGSVLSAAPDYPAAQLDAALGELDTRASDWAAKTGAVCRDETLAPAAAQAESACLDELLGSMRGLAGAFEHATPSTALALASSIRDLRPAASCDASKRSDALGSDAWSSEARAQIAELLARGRMGQITEATDGLKQLAAQAEARGARAIRVSAELSRTSLLMRASRHDDQTVVDVKAAVRLAEAERLDALAFRGRQQLAQLYGRFKHDPAAAKEAEQDARAALERIGSPPAEAAQLELVESWNASAIDDDRRALALLDDAERHCGGDCSPDVRAAIYAARAGAWAGSDPGPHSVVEAKRATELIEQLYGADSVELFNPLVQVAKAAVTAEEFEEAVRSADQALSLAARYHIEPSGFVAVAHGMRGIAHHELGHRQQARDELAAAEAMYAGLPGMEPFARIVNAGYLALMDVEDHDTNAVAHAKAAIALAGPDRNANAFPTLVLGLALGDTKEGRAKFDAGRAVFANDPTTTRWMDKERDKIWKR